MVNKRAASTEWKNKVASDFNLRTEHLPKPEYRERGPRTVFVST